MPRCFQLFKIGSDRPETLQHVDDVLWMNVGFCSPHKELWFANWYNTIGLGLACGKTFDDMFKEKWFEDIESIGYKALLYLSSHYSADAWYEHK